MADQELSDITEDTSVAADDQFYGVDAAGTTDKRFTGQTLADGFASLAGAAMLATGGTLLAAKHYLPPANITRNNTSFGDLDATNLAITFTAPSSGKVLVRVTFTGFHSSSTGTAWMNLREGTTDLADTERMVVSGTTSSGLGLSYSALVTGISAGSHTYKLGCATSNNTFTIAGGVSSLIDTSDGADAQLGSVTIEVWIAP